MYIYYHKYVCEQMKGFIVIEAAASISNKVSVMKQRAEALTFNLLFSRVMIRLWIGRLYRSIRATWIVAIPQQ